MRPEKYQNNVTDLPASLLLPHLQQQHSILLCNNHVNAEINCHSSNANIVTDFYMNMQKERKSSTNTEELFISPSKISH